MIQLFFFVRLRFVFRTSVIFDHSVHYYKAEKSLSCLTVSPETTNHQFGIFFSSLLPFPFMTISSSDCITSYSSISLPLLSFLLYSLPPYPPSLSCISLLLSFLIPSALFEKEKERNNFKAPQRYS